jgi:hypothetical protein
LFENILPALIEMGVREADLDYILTENPRRYLGKEAVLFFKKELLPSFRGQGQTLAPQDQTILYFGKNENP